MSVVRGGGGKSKQNPGQWGGKICNILGKTQARARSARARGGSGRGGVPSQTKELLHFRD